MLIRSEGLRTSSPLVGEDEGEGVKKMGPSQPFAAPVFILVVCLHLS